MKNSLCLFASLAVSAGIGFADTVQLRDGTGIEGTILVENPDSIDIEIGSNERGTIRRILRIHASEISSWSSDTPRSADTGDTGGMTPSSGVGQAERMLREAEALTRAGRLDEGIATFGQAADAAVGNLEAVEPAQKVEALKLRAHALRLQLAAMEGKVAILESRTKTAQDNLDEKTGQLKQDEDQLARDKADFDRNRPSGSVDIRTRQAHNELVSREEELKRRRLLLNREQDSIGIRARELEAEQVRTLTQMELLKERADRANDEARAAERSLRRRR